MPRVPEAFIKCRYGADCFARVTEDPFRRVEFDRSLGYQYIFDLFWPIAEAMLDIELTRPDVMVVHSLSASPAHFVNIHMNVLVYDQHLGQIFRQLNVFGTASAAPDAESLVINYFQQLFGQKCYVKSKFGAAYRLAQEYIKPWAVGKLAEIDETDDDRIQHAIVSLGQEAFVIGHEIGHILVRRGRPGDAFRVQSELTGEIALSGDIDDAWEHANAMWDIRDATLAAAGAGPAPRISREEAESEARQYQKEVNDAFNSDEKLVVERVCDYLGFVCAQEVYRSSLEKAPAELALPWHCAARASFGAMLNLQLVQLFDDQADGRGITNEYVLQSSIRNVSIRETLRRMAPKTVSADELEAIFPMQSEYDQLFFARAYAFPCDGYLKAGSRYDELGVAQRHAVREMLFYY